jgi:ABC-type phosphate transport system permease subunit
MIQTILLVLILIVCIICLGIVTGMYLRDLRNDNEIEQAAKRAKKYEPFI